MPSEKRVKYAQRAAPAYPQTYDREPPSARSCATQWPSDPPGTVQRMRSAGRDPRPAIHRERPSDPPAAHKLPAIRAPSWCNKSTGAMHPGRDPGAQLDAIRGPRALFHVLGAPDRIEAKTVQDQ